MTKCPLQDNSPARPAAPDKLPSTVRTAYTAVNNGQRNAVTGAGTTPLALAIFLSAFTVAITALGIALALRKLASPKTSHPITPEWVEELSIDRYRPMTRLLDHRDLQFLQSERAWNRKQLDDFRRQRIRTFREYLKRLNADFASVCMALKIVMLQSDADRPDLGNTLLRAQARFALGMVSVQVRLALYEIGIGRVEIHGLLSIFDGMRLQLRQMVPESAVWGS
jgi:hypothetical protein